MDAIFMVGEQRSGSNLFWRFLLVLVVAVVLCQQSWVLAQSSTAMILYPNDGAVNADLSQPIQWTSVANVQTYYLYVGTTPGAKDLVNTGEILRTSYLVAQLPVGQTVYARMWTKVGGVWRYTDSSFSAAPLPARLTYPVNGAVNANLSQPIQWTSVANVQAYYLYVGTTLGAKDLVNTGEILRTSYLAVQLPVGQTVYARLWTKVGGVWRYTDSSFSAAPLPARLTYPVDGAVNADLSKPIQWTSVANVQAYYLYVGTTLGAKDLMNTGEILRTSYQAAQLPVGQTVYARLWTKVGGAWQYTDSTFTVGLIAATFLYPVDGATGVDLTQPFHWTSPMGAQAYHLYVGTSPGANDVLDSGEVGGTSYLPNSLPSSGILYARIWTKVNNTWRHSDIAFTPEASILPAHIVVPVDGTATFDTGQPFEWSEVTLARGYRLTIGTAFGADDLHDTGEIHVTRRFVPDLPVGMPLFGRLQTKISGQWYATDFAFTVGANTVSATVQIDSALWATDFVRSMAPSDNRPFGWTALSRRIASQSQYDAFCTDYAATLLHVLGEMNIQTAARQLDLSFNATRLDAHTLVELLNLDTGDWILLDPTFSLSAKRSDGEWASAEDVSQATLVFDWQAISYVFLSAAGDSYARGYYLDYPLLYVNVYHQGQPFVAGQGPSPLQYLQVTTLPTSGSQDVYAVQCSGSASTEVLIDGTHRQVACDGVDATSGSFYASSVAAPSGIQPSFQLYRLQRFVF